MYGKGLIYHGNERFPFLFLSFFRGMEELPALSFSLREKTRGGGVRNGAGSFFMPRKKDESGNNTDFSFPRYFSC